MPIRKLRKRISFSFCRFMTMTMSATTVSLVAASLALIRFHHEQSLALTKPQFDSVAVSLLFAVSVVCF